MSDQEIQILNSGGIGVMPTDTLYGVVGSALKPETVERIYHLRERATGKPMIVLIANLGELRKFGIELTPKIQQFLTQIWPGKVSVVLPLVGAKFAYLHRGTSSLALRVPDRADLRELLAKTGPLVAPSANPEGDTPAETTQQARKYFGRRVDFYIDAGRVTSPPSTLIKIEGGAVTVLRPGAVAITPTKLS